MDSPLPLALACSQRHGDGDSQDPYAGLLGKLTAKTTRSETIKRRIVKKKAKVPGLGTVAYMMRMGMKMLRANRNSDQSDFVDMHASLRASALENWKLKSGPGFMRERCGM